MRKHLLSAAVLSGMVLAASAPAWAGIAGSTYVYSASASGGIQINNTGPQTLTDPVNAGFCIGPPLGCSTGVGVSGSYAFADVSPTLSTITFTFFGSTSTASGGFVIDLGDFATTDGSTIDNVTYDTGNFFTGDFSSVVWNGTDAVFTGSTSSNFNGSGSSVTFDVDVTPVTPAPEPASMTLLGFGLTGLGLIRRRWRKQG